ncbi:uncharacterized protein LOC144035499 [Vanacampus margaritifer]
MTPPEAHPLLPECVVFQSPVPPRPVRQSDSQLLCVAMEGNSCGAQKQFKQDDLCDLLLLFSRRYVATMEQREVRIWISWMTRARLRSGSHCHSQGERYLWLTRS